MAFGDLVPPSGSGLLGSIWAANEPQDDEYDRVRVVGSTVGVLADGETRTAELVIAPADSFGVAVSADIQAFRDAYRPVADDTFLLDLDAQFAEVVREAA